MKETDSSPEKSSEESFHTCVEEQITSLRGTRGSGMGWDKTLTVERITGLSWTDEERNDLEQCFDDSPQIDSRINAMAGTLLVQIPEDVASKDRESWVTGVRHRFAIAIQIELIFRQDLKNEKDLEVRAMKTEWIRTFHRFVLAVTKDDPRDVWELVVGLVQETGNQAGGNQSRQERRARLLAEIQLQGWKNRRLRRKRIELERAVKETEMSLKEAEMSLKAILEGNRKLRDLASTMLAILKARNVNVTGMEDLLKKADAIFPLPVKESKASNKDQIKSAKNLDDVFKPTDDDLATKDTNIVSPATSTSAATEDGMLSATAVQAGALDPAADAASDGSKNGDTEGVTRDVDAETWQVHSLNSDLLGSSC